MILHALRWVALCGALCPFVYYGLAIRCVRRFFKRKIVDSPSASEFLPPVSILKPVKGLDRDAYENFASFCRLDYPEYELLFAVASLDDPVLGVIKQLMTDFPNRSIRAFATSEVYGPNRKVNILCRLEREAKHNLLVINDSDIRVTPDYLRAITAPFCDSKVGAVTCLYTGIPDAQIGAELEAIGIATEYQAGVLVGRQLDGMKFALGSTIAVWRQRLKEIGGFQALADCHSDDFELGRRIAANGYTVEVPQHIVRTICSAESWRQYFAHQLRWGLTTRYCRPWGHIGVVLTMGLPWSLAAAAIAPSHGVAAAYLGTYAVLRMMLAWNLGVRGLGDQLVRRKWWLVPLRDALAFPIWLSTFFVDQVEWRGTAFRLERDRLVPVPQAEDSAAAETAGVSTAGSTIE